ncbi:MAG: hypothetical protein AB4372_38995 [Xenococcus sp. (in: cyanobacteria)]
MLNLFSHPPSKNNNLEKTKDESSINLDVKFNVNIQGEVLIKTFLCLLGSSVIAGSVYGFSNNLSPAETDS